MNFVSIILTMLLSLVPAYNDKETWEEREARMEIVAQSIDDAVSNQTCTGKYENPLCIKKWPHSKKMLAVLLITKGNFESHFAKNIHSGKCKNFQCDVIRKNGAIYHKARSPWQIQETGFLKPGEWEMMNGDSLAETTVSANVAARILTSGILTCNTVKGAFGHYAGAGCDWDTQSAKDRTKAFYRLMSRSQESLIKSRKIHEKNVRDRIERSLNRKNTNLVVTTN